MAGDLLTRGLYFIIVAVCAPVWEEVCPRISGLDFIQSIYSAMKNAHAQPL